MKRAFCLKMLSSGISPMSTCARLATGVADGAGSAAGAARAATRIASAAAARAARGALLVTGIIPQV